MPVRDDINQKLTGVPPSTTPFPPCADMLLAAVGEDSEKILDWFNEYFQFAAYAPGHSAGWPRAQDLRDASKRADKIPWPFGSCQANSHVTLTGTRRSVPDPGKPRPKGIKTLFVADLVWLYYLERMGAFRALTAVLDDYEYVGKYTLRESDEASKVLETMVRARRMRVWSSSEDRESTYLRVLGWPTGSPLRSHANPTFATAFFDLVRLVLRYLSERRLQPMFAGGAIPTPVAAVLDLLETLRRSFYPFDLGRNRVNAISGLVWCIGGLALLRYLHVDEHSFGVAVGEKTFDQYFPGLLGGLEGAAPPNDALVSSYLNCAAHARNILLDIQGLDVTTATVERWLADPDVQQFFEGFAAAHRGLPQGDFPAEWRI